MYVCSSMSLFMSCRLFGRFRILQSLNIDLANMPRLVLACMVLHNLVEFSEETFDRRLLKPSREFARFREEELHHPRADAPAALEADAGKAVRESIAELLMNRYQ